MSIETGLTGKTALITGGGAGIGAETARRFAAQDAHVVIFERDAELAEKISQELSAAEVITADVSDDEVVDEVFTAMEGRGAVCDILVNNVARNTSDSFLAIGRDDILRDIELTLAVPMKFTQRVLPAMIRLGGGVVINVASINGLEYYGNESYSAAKAGLISFTKSIAAAYGPQGIRCNAIAPGTIQTAAWQERMEADPEVFDKLVRWYPLGRVGHPDDIADAAVFLASDQARWISGECLTVDGGITSGKPLMAQDMLTDQVR